MNKYFTLLSIVATIAFYSTNAIANPFQKLIPYITTQAQKWVTQNNESLSDDYRIAFLNFFIYSQKNADDELKKCFQYIGSDENAIEAFKNLEIGTLAILEKYVEPIYKKIMTKKDLTDKEQQTVFEKLQAKIEELFAYINAVYYNTLYNDIATKKPHLLMYMFDKNGIIAEDKRSQKLPACL